MPMLNNEQDHNLSNANPLSRSFVELIDNNGTSQNLENAMRNLIYGLFSI